MAQADNGKICIVMATYNGARYVRQQLESIQSQTNPDWRLIIRDDGSTDGTAEILDEIAASDSRISILDSCCKTGLGPSLNFSAALQASLTTDRNIFFICDQDDVWEHEKLAVQSSMFQQGGLENKPLLVHSDLAVVDEDLNTIHHSLIRYMNLQPEPEAPLNYLLTRNFVTGCATAVNRRLLELALPISDNAIMHDWWLAFAAAANGTIEFLDTPLVQYRQHSDNSVGAKGFWHGLDPTNNWVAGWKAGNDEYRATHRQVDAVVSHAEKAQNWSTGSIEVLRQYLTLVTLSPVNRLMAARKLGLRQGNILLQLIFYIRLLTVNGKMPAFLS